MGLNGSGRRDGGFNKGSGSRYAVMIEMAAAETRQRQKTKMAVKGVVLWGTM